MTPLVRPALYYKWRVDQVLFLTQLPSDSSQNEAEATRD
jgi:hypothetical protein